MLRQPKYRAIYQILVAVWLTLSIASVLLAAFSWAQLSLKISAARELGKAGSNLDQILQTMLEGNLSVRGYVITGDTNILAPFYASETNQSSQFDSLADLSSGNTNMLKAVVDLRAQAEALDDFNQQIVEARGHSFSRAQELIIAGDARKLVEGVRAQLTLLDKIYYKQFLDMREEIGARLLRAILTSLIAGALGIGAGIFALWLARLTIKHQAREQELIEGKLQAERSNREKTVFLANMSHEIRTPMNAIMGFSELLQNDLSEPKHRHYIKSIRASAGSLLQLINDILDMSKIEAGVLELHPEPTDSREICDFVHALFSELALKKGIKLKCDVAEDLPRALLIDRIRLRQILVNLVGNAIKFTDRGGVDLRIFFEKQKRSSRVTLMIEVQDTGVGIPRDKLDAIFKPFVQAGTHREKEVQGTGLGLSIVKRLTEMMGGTVTVASVVGQGSAFSLKFTNVPISARLAESEKISSEAETDFNKLHPATMLVADDNKANCDLIAGIFEGTHHRLVICSNGEEATAKAREIKPDILLLDVRMPGIGGREALARIRKIPGMELVPSIAVTASSTADERQILTEYFSGYVQKPFSRRELFDELAEFLPRHATETETVAAEKTVSTETAVAVAVPKELLTELRQLIVEAWPAIRDSVAINESKAFARRLENLGRQWQCMPLTSYAQKLLHDAETYAVTDLEKHLGEFAALVEQLAQNAQQ